MGIVAGLLVQNTLKYLLNFGCVTPFLGYDALNDYFPSYRMKPNAECEDSFCRRRQKEVRDAERNNTQQVIPETIPEVIVEHENNDWGISVVDESVASETTENVAPGLRLAYEQNVRSCSAPAETDSPSSSGDNKTSEGAAEDTDLETLMAQLKGLN